MARTQTHGNLIASEKVHCRIGIPCDLALASALQAEAVRQLSTPGRVAALALRALFPIYVEERLRHDLGPAGPVLDVEARSAT